MSVIVILILASLAVGLVFVTAFVWSVRNGQYEDTFTPAMRVLAEDDTGAGKPSAATRAEQTQPGQPAGKNERANFDICPTAGLTRPL